ncbi:DUF397 domain-containing protein [Catellatospora sp. TT07R-123]|uniref:DUF397 domain-containing protein n=1 Tax=Catellatospora sp. TT07R-123 TaxID=2733863 RepID=UPI001B15A2EA|nr:DUF397 domain-containing protein [Catellatospora sp. TT07R-123]GHJ45908.1 DUF397 domain-containing protein [Catellatospora sp. TT07R-123]
MEHTTLTNWRKSTRSGGGDNCVEVATSEDGSHVGVRDSKDPNGGILAFPSVVWQEFLAGIRRGDFDL